PVRERELDLRIHLHLTDARELVLDRVLDRDDVLLGGIDLLERRVERGRLAAAGRAGDEDDAVALADQTLHGLQILTGEPELLEPEQRRRAVEQTHDDALAE